MTYDQTVMICGVRINDRDKRLSYHKIYTHSCWTTVSQRAKLLDFVIKILYLHSRQSFRRSSRLESELSAGNTANFGSQKEDFFLDTVSNPQINFPFAYFDLCPEKKTGLKIHQNPYWI